nr:PREDICTED: uncharacterized protein LOC105671671 [Linepithema humile]
MNNGNLVDPSRPHGNVLVLTATKLRNLRGQPANRVTRRFWATWVCLSLRLDNLDVFCPRRQLLQYLQHELLLLLLKLLLLLHHRRGDVRHRLTEHLRRQRLLLRLFALKTMLLERGLRQLLAARPTSSPTAQSSQDSKSPFSTSTRHGNGFSLSDTMRT